MGLNSRTRRSGSGGKGRTRASQTGNTPAAGGDSGTHAAGAKTELVREICDQLAERKLSQADAATLLGLDQPKVSALVRGRVTGYSLDRLMRCLIALGQVVEITVRPANPGEAPGGPRVVVIRARAHDAPRAD